MLNRNHLAFGTSVLLLGGILSGCAANIDALPGEGFDPAAVDDSASDDSASDELSQADSAAEDGPEDVGSAAQALGESHVILHPGESRRDVTTYGWWGTTTVEIVNRGTSNGALLIQAQTPWPVAPETITACTNGSTIVQRQWAGYWVTLTNSGQTDLDVTVR